MKTTTHSIALMRLPRSIAVAGVLGVLSTTMVAAATVAGRTPAQFAVSQGGAATYAVPIEVPPGIGGLQPGLTLQYNSQSGRGIAGIGWSLEGVSSIRRCGKTQRQDGVQGGINLSSNDRFCMDHQRLVLDGTTKPYGADGAVYRTELDTFARVTSSGVTGTGPTSFKVETKSGLVLEFGGTADSRFIPAAASSTGTAPTTVLMWALNKVTDRSGNSVSYKYLSDTAAGSHRLDRIEYNGGRAIVRFAYEADPNAVTAFVAGARVTHPVLLSEVSTVVLGTSDVEIPVRQYRIGYEYEDIKGGAEQYAAARVMSITECAPHPQCRAPITFAWAYWSTGSDRSFRPAAELFFNSSTFSGADGWGDERLYYRRFADMDKNGFLDIVGFGGDGTYVSFVKKLDAGILGSARKLVTREFGHDTWRDNADTWQIRPRHVIDMNRDGYPDIVGFANGTLRNLNHGTYVSIWNPATQMFGPSATIPAAALFTNNFGHTCGSNISDIISPKYLIDMNKDGYPDILGFGLNGVYYSAWNGSTVTAPKLVSGSFRMDAQDGGSGPSNWLTRDCMGTDRQPIHLEDMNSDGYPDVVAIGTDGVFLMLWDPVSEVFSAPANVSVQFPVGYRNGMAYPTQLVDMNGDGYQDLVAYWASGVWVSLWNGKGFNPASYWTNDFSFSPGTDLSKNPRRLVDVNGDGFPDVVAFHNDGVYVAFSNGNGKILPAVRWTTDFPANGTDSFSNVWDRDNVNSPRHLVDLDGDGALDIVGFGSRRVIWASPKGPRGTRIHQITDSLGAETVIQYTLAQPYSDYYAKDAVESVWPVRDVQGPLLVVSGIFRNARNGSLSQQHERYRYGGLKSHALHGSLGFRWMSVRDELNGLELRREYDQAYPFVGSLAKQYKLKSALSGTDSLDCGAVWARDKLCLESPDTAAGLALSSLVNTYAQEELAPAGEYASNKRLFTYLRQSSETGAELDGTTLPTKATTFLYDEPIRVPGRKQWGNLTEQSVTIGGGFVATTQYSYHPADETNWLLGLVSQAKVTKTRPAREVTMTPPADAAPPPGTAPPKPISPEVLSVILSILLDD